MRKHKIETPGDELIIDEQGRLYRLPEQFNQLLTQPGLFQECAVWPSIYYADQDHTKSKKS